jgi:hypothetical protein
MTCATSARGRSGTPCTASSSTTSHAWTTCTRSTVKATCGPGTAYGLAGLRNIIQRLAERGDRNNAMYVAAVQTGELVAGGQLDGAYAMDVLREAAEQITPDELWKSKNTIARGVRHGLENPRVPRRAA